MRVGTFTWCKIFCSKLKDEDTAKAFTITQKNSYQMLEEEGLKQADKRRHRVRLYCDGWKKDIRKWRILCLADPGKRRNRGSWRPIEEREEMNKKILAACSLRKSEETA